MFGYPLFYSTTGVPMLVMSAHTRKTSYAISAGVRGITPCRIRKLLIRPIARSTCIHNSAILCVSITCLDDSCCICDKKGGMFKCTPSGASTSLMSKLLSVITLSPGSSSSSIPHYCGISLSETRPPQSLDTNVTTPPGLIPTRTLNVLWCL